MPGTSHIEVASYPSQLEIRNFNGGSTYGGPAYMPGLLVNTWEQGLDNALVATDRQGDPSFMITKYALPQMPEPTVRQVANKVSVASKKYLKYNTHQGCTDLTSPSFDYKANSGDTSLCSLAPNNYTFGGVFQNCSSPQDYGRDICAGLRQKNPLSGTYGCPSGYDAVKLNTGSETFNWNDHECHTEYHHCGFLWLQKCGRQVCSTQYLGAVANYETYWCVKLGPVEPKSGYLFGGIYSASSTNLVTGHTQLSQVLLPAVYGSSMKVCVSDNYEQGIASSVPFAGFFSCHIGNPLSLISTPAAEKAGISAVGYGLLIGEESWPHHCPHGYAQHLASIDESCAVEYCVKSHAFDRPSRLLLKRPPYGKAYPMPQNNTVELNFITGPSGKTWSRNGTAGSWKRNFRGLELEAIQQPSSSLQTPSHHTDTQMVAGVSVASVFACVLLIALVVTCRKNQRLQRRGFQPPLISGETASTSTGYTSVNTTPAPDAISSESARQRTGYSTLG
ncbi:LOW QUALITY PROTEIN: macrophage-expressed gene 1 protein-like [Sycon ciliatum]|uniref:LOW QUALITY PROTEIN: macrophage-expressed gene 1 protein-like n=1 Tax=Sycon ciliatum TaxID=27933 RepID=UPI0031F63746